MIKYNLDTFIGRLNTMNKKKILIILIIIILLLPVTYNDQNNYRFYDSVWDFFEKVMPDEKKFIVFYGDIYYE